MDITWKCFGFTAIWITVSLWGMNEAKSVRSLKYLASDETRECGMAKERVSRIVGGKKAEENEFPWMAFLVFKFVNVKDEDDDVFFSCGGSLIHPSWILTAAHCLNTEEKIRGEAYKMKRYLVSLAEYDVMHENNDETIIVQSSLGNIHRHPEYQKRTVGDNDIGLIRLEEPVELSSRISVICLPKHGESLDVKGLSVVNSGWGKKEHNKEAEYLRKATAQGISNELCGQFFQNGHITDSMMCTLSETSNHCMGDSGSPVISKTTTGNYVQLGIVGMSFVDDKNECLTGFPSIHTSVSKMLNWIEKVTEITQFP